MSNPKRINDFLNLKELSRGIIISRGFFICGPIFPVRNQYMARFAGA